jgi:sodium transport system permease protein
VILVIPEEYAEDFSSGKSAAIQLVIDSSRQSAQVDVSRIRGLLEQYSSYLGALRLIVRGVSPEVIRAVNVEEVDVATPQSQATVLVSFLPYFIIFAIFNGAAPVITDTTAGERERQSLEPLLINPVPRRIFVLGKLLAAFPFSIATLAITLLGFGFIFNVLPIEEYIGVRISLDAATLILIFLTCLPIVFLASAIQMVVASFARSTKEAGTYLPFIALIPSLPGLALAFYPVKPAIWTMLIPTFGQQLLINQLMRLEPVSPSNAVISTAMTLLLASVITLVAIRLYNREQIVFRKS